MFGKKLYRTVKEIKIINTIELFTFNLEINSVFILIYRFKLKFALHHVPFQQYVILCNHNTCDEITKLLTLI